MPREGARQPIWQKFHIEISQCHVMRHHISRTEALKEVLCDSPSSVLRLRRQQLFTFADEGRPLLALIARDTL